MFGFGKSRDIFNESYRSLMEGIPLSGGSPVVLGTLIFMFPQLVGFMFVAFILAPGPWSFIRPTLAENLKCMLSGTPWNMKPNPRKSTGTVRVSSNGVLR